MVACHFPLGYTPRLQSGSVRVVPPLNRQRMVVVERQGWIRATIQKECDCSASFDMHLLIDYLDWSFVRKILILI